MVILGQLSGAPFPQQDDSSFPFRERGREGENLPCGGLFVKMINRKLITIVSHMTVDQGAFDKMSGIRGRRFLSFFALLISPSRFRAPPTFSETETIATQANSY